jgi:hypothetical protein
MIVPPLSGLLLLMPTPQKKQDVLDTAGGASYNPRDMDSLNDLRPDAVVLSSRLWNWWAVPTAR